MISWTSNDNVVVVPHNYLVDVHDIVLFLIVIVQPSFDIGEWVQITNSCFAGQHSLWINILLFILIYPRLYIGLRSKFRRMTIMPQEGNGISLT